MNRSQISQGIRLLGDRVISDGGFTMRPWGNFRPDATAWAVVALTILDAEPDLRAAARQRLAAEQLEDGRINVSQDHPESFWPTSLAVLAWQGDPAFKDVQGRAANFLLETSGLYWKNNSKAIFGHDSNLKGWPWRSNTASWSEPTAMAMMALG